MDRVIATAGCALLLGGCFGGGGWRSRPRAPDGRVLAADIRTPFAPARVRIHPLTHLGRDTSDDPVIVLHIEMLDAWDDGVKGVGLLSVEVVGAGTPRQWDVDLFDMSVNAPAYDPHTRTYRFQLAGLPDWLSARDGQSGSARLRCTLQTLDRAGKPIELVDEMELR